MNEKELQKFVEALYPYIEKKMLQSNSFKTIVKRKNATVVNTALTSGESNIGENVEVVLPYDTTSFLVKNETGKDLVTNDLVCIEYCIDLKNAIAVYKVN